MNAIQYIIATSKRRFMFLHFDHNVMNVNEFASDGHLLKWRLGQNLLKTMIVLYELRQRCLFGEEMKQLLVSDQLCSN